MKKGEKMSEEQKAKIRARLVGSKRPWGREVAKRKNVREKIRLTKIGDKNPQWNGGKIINRGYIFIRVSPCLYKKQSRHVVEKRLGRELESTELVHHINGNRSDDRIKNLFLCSRSFHQKIHNHNLLVISNI